MWLYYQDTFKDVYWHCALFIAILRMYLHAFFTRIAYHSPVVYHNSGISRNPVTTSVGKLAENQTKEFSETLMKHED